MLDVRNWAKDPITTLEMGVIDRNAEYFGVPRRVLMENAGRAVAAAIIERRPDARRVLVVAGLGDNGGDGVVAARYLYSWGKDVIVILLGRINDVRSRLLSENLEVVINMGLEVNETPTPLDLLSYQGLFHPWADTIVDAIMGTGVRGAIREPQATAIDLINRSSAFRVAVDVPSGLDPDTGEVRDTAVRAHVTVTMHRPKVGLLKESARPYVGELMVADIGIPEIVEHLVGPGDMLHLNYARRPNAKKGDHGRLLMVGGSREYTGAVYLAGYSALRTGADLVTLMVPRDVARDIRSMNPSLIAIPLDGDYLSINHVDQIVEQLSKVHVLAIGPGLGLRDETMRAVVDLISRALDLNKKIVIDADAIKALGELGRQDLVTSNVIVTPHAGEFKWLTGVDLGELGIRERIRRTMEVARSRLKGGVVLLKGNVDLITDGNRYKLNMTGNPGMTVGGTGDVLTGVVSALYARINDPLEAAALGAFITGLAGDIAVRELGYHITPIDVVERIPQAFKLLVSDVAESSLVHPKGRASLLGLSPGSRDKWI